MTPPPKKASKNLKKRTLIESLHFKQSGLVRMREGDLRLLCRLAAAIAAVLQPQLASAKGQCTAGSPVEFRDGERDCDAVQMHVSCYTILLVNGFVAANTYSLLWGSPGCFTPPHLVVGRCCGRVHSPAGHRRLPVDQGHRLCADHRRRHKALLPIAAATHSRRRPEWVLVPPPDPCAPIGICMPSATRAYSSYCHPQLGLSFSRFARSTCFDFRTQLHLNLAMLFISLGGAHLLC